jgi:hypothetical protein
LIYEDRLLRKRMARGVLNLWVAWLLISSATAMLPAKQESVELGTAEYTIPEGTLFKLQVHTTVNSVTSKRGDRLVATLVEPVPFEDADVLPKGSRVDGHIQEVKAAGYRGKGGYLSVVFDSVELPNGQKLPIAGSLTEVFFNAKGGEPNVGHGELMGRRPSRVAQIAIVAGATGAGAKAGLGAGIGAGVVGIVTAILLPRGKEAALSAGSVIGMRLDRDLRFSLPKRES